MSLILVRSCCLLSRMFDTVDHEILIKCLVSSFGISGRPLDWLCSFPNGWTVMVKLAQTTRLGHQCYLVSCKAQYLGCFFTFSIHHKT